jgi:predicted neuraminidase
MIHREFIFEKAPFASAHASTIAETPHGLAAAWFAGAFEGHGEVGIWLAVNDGQRWSEPMEVAAGTDRRGRRVPCWNPVLHQPAAGPLLLFYKVGPSPSRWWGMVTTSADGGATWTEPRRLDGDFLGPIKNKPVARPGGALLCPSSTEHAGWRVHLEETDAAAQRWRHVATLNDGRQFAAIQPAILAHCDGRLQVLCRTRQGVIAECWSGDGDAWSPMTATTLPNPDSGIDAVMLHGGSALVVYNHATCRRTPLNVAVTHDGHSWHAAKVLEDEPGEFSYPAVIQGADGRIHITYTWNRQRVRYVWLDPRELNGKPLDSGFWPG